MVSKLDILSRYYQIHLGFLESDYFFYEGHEYYITDINVDDTINSYYQLYMQDLGLQGFLLVPNCFGNNESEGHTLYIYQEEPYSLSTVLHNSFKTIEGQTASLLDIKHSWCNIIDTARRIVATHASRLNHNEHYVILSYYYQGLGENVISIIQGILDQDESASLPLGVEHGSFYSTYNNLFNPCNIIISTRVRDIALAYRHQYITIDQLDRYIQQYVFDEIEIMYLYCRILFPTEFFQLILSKQMEEPELKEQLIYIYKQLNVEKQLLTDVYYCLQKYVYIPEITWLMKEK